MSSEHADLSETIHDRAERVGDGIGRAGRGRQQVINPETDDEQRHGLLQHASILTALRVRTGSGAPGGVELTSESFKERVGRRKRVQRTREHV